MKRLTETFQVHDIDSFKQQMLNWANRFNIFIFFDSSNYADKYSSFNWILAADPINEFNAKDNVAEALDDFISKKEDWLFGHINYDFKNYLEPLTSVHADNIQFPETYFFQPSIVIRHNGDGLIEITSDNIAPSKIFSEINLEKESGISSVTSLNIRPRISKDEYLDIIKKLRQHILRGDCYEINFCQEFFAENVVIDPLNIYRKLYNISPTPFAGFYKLNDKYLLCASPERFIKKEKNSIISQPIKGTSKRDPANNEADELLKQQLQLSKKDQSENVMVVDLVRNDLSKVCKENSVCVEELFGVYSFPQVHQLISTVRGELANEASFVDVIKATFPMGSMTGAPKFRVMQLIEQYEKTKRGIYSGTIGYLSPDNDFDFNVVIRSIMYNSSNRYLSYQVGGGITFYSDPEKEYEECLVKAAAIKKVLQNEHLL